MVIHVRLDLKFRELHQFGEEFCYLVGETIWETISEEGITNSEEWFASRNSRVAEEPILTAATEGGDDDLSCFPSSSSSVLLQCIKSVTKMEICYPV